MKSTAIQAEVASYVEIVYRTNNSNSGSDVFAFVCLCLLFAPIKTKKLEDHIYTFHNEACSSKCYLCIKAK